jgi:hypothetical protein
MEIPTSTRRDWFLPLKRLLHPVHGGSVKKWFSDLVSTKRSPDTGYGCWRTSEGKRHCSGQHQNIYLCVSLPGMLILDLELDDSTGDAPIWDFPQKLFPSTLRAAQDHGLVYDLVGRGLYNPTASHFIARYAKDKAIYTYDGMKHGGYSIQEKNAKISMHLYGENVIIPSGYRTHVVIYHLRGGPDAQALFYRAQIATAHRLYNLNFSFETLDHLANITSHQNLAG